jgi:predicted MFS family arabinose efflux permease
LFWNETAAAIISFCAGFSAMLTTVATLTLAADYCPPRAEGFSFAVLMSIINLANTLADNIGSFLYTHAFDRALPPLVLISAAFTAFAFVLVPLLRLGDKRQGEPMEMAQTKMG